MDKLFLEITCNFQCFLHKEKHLILRFTSQYSTNSLPRQLLMSKRKMTLNMLKGIDSEKNILCEDTNFAF